MRQRSGRGDRGKRKRSGDRADWRAYTPPQSASRLIVHGPLQEQL